MKLNSILIFAEFSESKLNPVFYELLTKAKSLTQVNDAKISCLLLGSNLDDVVLELKLSGVDEVILLDDSRLELYNIDYYSAAICEAVSELDPDVLLFGATSIGEELAPTIGLRLKTGVAAHCMDVRMNDNGEFSQLVPAFGGKVIGEIFTPMTKPKIASLKPGILSSEQFLPNKDCLIINLDQSILDNTITSIRAISLELEPAQENSIEKAQFIVCAGYGVAQADITDDLEKLSNLLGGAVGYTRPAIDAGMAQNENNMIGTSGKSIKPKIYFGVGVSGSTHHVCGMKDSEMVITINTDPNSEIFKVSDYKAVGDGALVIKELINLMS